MRPTRLAIAMGLLIGLLTGCGTGAHDASVPFCFPNPGGDAAPLILMAQAVPSAAYIPCISAFPGGWTFGGERIRNGRSEFWLNSDRAGYRALTVLFAPSCDISRAVPVPPEAGEPRMDRYEEPTALPPTFSGSRYYVFPGGCVTYRFSFIQGATYTQAVEATEALSFTSRALGVTELAKDGYVLCGRGVACPG